MGGILIAGWSPNGSATCSQCAAGTYLHGGKCLKTCPPGLPWREYSPRDINQGGGGGDYPSDRLFPSPP